MEIFVEDGMEFRCEEIEDGIITFQLNSGDRISFVISRFAEMVSLGMMALNAEVNRTTDELRMMVDITNTSLKRGNGA